MKAFKNMSFLFMLVFAAFALTSCFCESTTSVCVIPADDAPAAEAVAADAADADASYDYNDDYDTDDE